MSKSALLILSEGNDAMEVAITVDVLRRAGMKVVIAGLQGANPTKCSQGIVIVPDISIQDAAKTTYDAVILPGGSAGVEKFARSDIVKDILQTQEKNGRLIAAICAAPLALKSHSVGIGKAITSYLSKKADLDTGEYQYVESRVAVAEQLITSRAPGTAFEFALAIVENLLGKEKADSFIDFMLINMPKSS